ncbi:hypothetical protein MLD38_003282 [Melastoma candidum]|uniref:Uncharacterized protein n=1 Tax=Melastoma candidum TaxID=119954 RepID=A0ACB9S1J6_9MYRT|nr:hypothetical protein MLD38_003282 [Melastoma candidum]
MMQISEVELSAEERLVVKTVGRKVDGLDQSNGAKEGQDLPAESERSPTLEGPEAEAGIEMLGTKLQGSRKLGGRAGEKKENEVGCNGTAVGLVKGGKMTEDRE